jgi:hypothetical protein
MAQPLDRSSRELPVWVVVGGSLLIILHFLAVGAVVLAAQSGPWWVPQLSRESPALGPKFVETIGDTMSAHYLEPLRLAQTYHFNSNRLGKTSAIFFEAKLRDAQGALIQTVRFPSADDNFWLRHRYQVLAQNIGNDQIYQPRGGEVVPVRGAKTPTVTIWDTSNPKFWKLKTELEHLVPKTSQVWQPSELSRIWAASFQRYLLREYDAAVSVELIRHSRNPVLPDYMYMKENELPPDAFEELTCSFGEYRREK